MTNRSDSLFPISIAPMMDYTDRHYRMLMRQFTKKTVLYTEMISTGAILNGDRKRHLEFSEEEKPLVLQVGGDNPKELAECTRIAADYGYDEININIGCPSERVQKGAFGAVLMATPLHVGHILECMCATNTIPVSIKCRLGIDGTKIHMPVKTSYHELEEFANIVMNAGSTRLIVHARIAILGGLSPKENRVIPQLNYEWVYQLAKEYPEYHIEINGGVVSLEEIRAHLLRVNGVMVGRAAVENPIMFSGIDELFEVGEMSVGMPRILASNKALSLSEICISYAEYLESIQSQVYTHQSIRHLIPLYNGVRGARRWRQILSTMLQQKVKPVTAVKQALQYSGVLEHINTTRISEVQ